MATKFLEPGGDATFGITLWPASGGTAPTVASDFVHGGHLRSIKYSVSLFSYLLASNSVADAGGRVSVWIYLNALPSGTSSLFQLEKASDGSGVCTVQITSGGVLQLATGDAPHTQIGTNGSTLSTGTWYRLSLAWTITSTSVNTIKLWKNGTLDISVTNATLLFNVCADFQIGNGDATTLDMRTSDHYIDNSTALTDPGNIWVTAKRPNANGTLNEFTTQVGAGGSGYGTGHSPQVNERALSTTNGWSFNTTTKKTEEYTIESAATGDIDISAATIVDFMGWINAKEASASNSPVTHIIVGGVATVVTLTTLNAIYKAIAGSTTYPSTGAAIGMDGQYTTTAHIYTLNECGIVIAYIPASGTAYTQSLTAGLSFTGAHTKLTARSLPGVLSFGGLLSKTTRRQLTATLSFGRLNFAANPSFEADTIGSAVTPASWASYTSLGSATYKGPANDYATQGSQSFKITTTVTSDLGIKMSFSGCEPGHVFTISADVKAAAGNTGNASVVATDNSDGSGDPQGGFVGANTVTRVKFQKTIGAAGTISIFLGFGSFTTNAIGTAWFDGVLIEDGNPSGQYFDGSYPNSSWTGTANNSFSSQPEFLVRQVNKALTAASSFTGAIATALSHTGTQFNQALTAGLSFAGAMTRAVKRPLTATITFTGANSRSTTHSFTANLSSSGAVARQSLRSLAAAVSSAGSVTRSIGKQLGASLSSSGVIGRVIGHLLTGNLSMSGSALRRVNRSLAGGAGFAGTFAKQMQHALTGSVSFAGTVATHSIFGRAFTAAVGFAGQSNMRTSKFMTGSVSYSGAAIRSIARILTGGLSSSGVLTKRGAHALTAALSAAGTLATGAFHAVTFTASLSPAGSISRRVSKIISGSLAFAGATRQGTSRVLTAGLSSAGSLTRKTVRSLAGATSFVGALVSGAFHALSLTANLSSSGVMTRRTNRALAGGVSMAGAQAHAVSRSFTAGLSYTGNVAKRIGRSFTGAVSSAGAMSRNTLRSFVAAVTSASSQSRQVRRSLAGSAGFTGTQARATTRSFTGSVAFAGSQTRRVAKQFQGAVGYSGGLARRVAKTLTASITPGGTLATVRALGIAFTAGLSFVGAASRKSLRNLTASLGFFGLLSNLIRTTLRHTNPVHLRQSPTTIELKSNPQAIELEQNDASIDLRQADTSAIILADGEDDAHLR